MKRLLVLVVCLLTGAVGARTNEDFAEVIFSPPAEPWMVPTFWIQPVSTAAAAVVGGVSGNFLLVLPLGVNIPLSPTQDLVVELTPFMGLFQAPSGQDAVGSYLAVGSLWNIAPHGSGGGFFVHVKGVGAIAEIKKHHVFQPSEEPSFTQTQLSMGMDIGYRYKFKHGVVDLLVGASVGMGFNVEPPNLLFGVVSGSSYAPRDPQFVLEPNLHLLRVGTSF